MKNYVGAVALVLTTAMMSPALSARYDVTEKSIATLQHDMASGRVTSEGLVRLYLARIKTIDRAGPALHSVLAINPNALADARALDRERKAKGPRGPLHGIPVLIKDNIETADPMPTTAGSLALADNVTHRDAPLVARLRAAGAVILGKTNLSEWANIRSSHSISGWSAVGGQTKNPYVLDRGPCGSSAGSAVAVSANLAAVAIGTETNGSLVCPGSFDGIVALKPTVGLVPRTHIVPISHSQDTAGPMTRSVDDAALVLSVIAGSDPADAATADADEYKANYEAALWAGALKGARVAVVMDFNPVTATETDAVFARAVAALEAAGIVVVKIKPLAVPPDYAADERAVLVFELKHDLNDYFASLPAGAQSAHARRCDRVRQSHAPRETALFGQELFEDAQTRGDLTDPDYVTRRRPAPRLRAHDAGQRLRRQPRGRARRNHHRSFARIDTVRRDGSGRSAAFFPAVAGYPHLTVPMGTCMAFRWGFLSSDRHGRKQNCCSWATRSRKALPARRAPTYIPSLESTPDVAKAFAPVAS